LGESILVTGGAGYIGSHMSLMLAEAGHRVTVLDNLFRGHADAVPAGAELLRVDLRDRAALEAAVRPGRFAAALHFAALAYVGESVAEPAGYWAVNAAGSLNLLEALRAAGTARLVFSSTCATYGEPERLPLDESHPQRPVNPYGRSKLAVEQMLGDFAAAYGFRSIALRYFNVAGCDPAGRLGERHEPETHLIPLVLREAARVLSGGRPEDTALKVFGSDFPTPDGTAVRDYVHVDDLCRAHLAALERLLAGRASGFEAYNLGGGTGHTVRQVIDSARRVTGAVIRYAVHPRRPGDPARLVASSAKAAEVLGWTPRFTDLDAIVATAWNGWGRYGRPAS
jgi:UDP-glucose-4-epimerase GalE